MKRKVLAVLLAMGLVVGTASAQFGGVVYDPTNYHNALLRYYQLQQHLVQLQKTYAQIVSQYSPKLEAQAAKLERDPCSDGFELNAEVSILNKIQAAGLLPLRSLQDSNQLLTSLLEQQIILAKQPRESTADSINADIQRSA